MHSNAPQDHGFVHWYVFIPGVGTWAVPHGISDRVKYARKVRATRLLRGNEIVWSAPASRPVRHLAVVR